MFQKKSDVIRGRSLSDNNHTKQHKESINIQISLCFQTSGVLSMFFCTAVESTFVVIQCSERRNRSKNSKKIAQTFSVELNPASRLTSGEFDVKRRRSVEIPLQQTGTADYEECRRATAVVRIAKGRTRKQTIGRA